ncbi:hypothetical protein HETIRDRAFT_106062 [Heterobasidion irregulare TC 32-1]|uniref:Uncharacterized protein n=1 Tax=Heterobasidion irregulare (strain TC 32-1) TaxID=747525 RepID=W4JSV7_HETIT|nr:uncharacterized protein HETIRDRAFT_106062 [Heterobasidion irregulare TC 32-1]ETW76623.1 hypothetical protein HETIRDRAFT_106062 [Heterobasidion irregulare TC 32-1]
MLPCLAPAPYSSTTTTLANRTNRILGVAWARPILHPHPPATLPIERSKRYNRSRPRSPSPASPQGHIVVITHFLPHALPPSRQPARMTPTGSSPKTVMLYHTACGPRSQTDSGTHGAAIYSPPAGPSSRARRGASLPRASRLPQPPRRIGSHRIAIRLDSNTAFDPTQPVTARKFDRRSGGPAVEGQKGRRQKAAAGSRQVGCRLQKRRSAEGDARTEARAFIYLSRSRAYTAARSQSLAELGTLSARRNALGPRREALLVVDSRGPEA